VARKKHKETFLHLCRQPNRAVDELNLATLFLLVDGHQIWRLGDTEKNEIIYNKYIV